MQCQPKLQISFPTCINGATKRGKNKGVPRHPLSPNFIVVGRVNKEYPNPLGEGGSVKVDKITAEVVSLTIDPAIKVGPVDCPFRKQGNHNPNEILWNGLLKVPMNGHSKAAVLLIVKAYGGEVLHLLDQASIYVWISLTEKSKEPKEPKEPKEIKGQAPTIDYPEPTPEYDITGDERDSFYCYGTADNTPAVSIVNISNPSESYTPFDQGFTDKTWWAVFDPDAGPGICDEGVYELLVTEGGKAGTLGVYVDE